MGIVLIVLAIATLGLSLVELFHSKGTSLLGWAAGALAVLVILVEVRGL